MRTKPSASWGAHMPFTAKDSASFGPRASTRTFQTSEPPRGKKTTTLRCGRFSTDGKTHVSDGETTARWGVVARSPMKVMNRVWSGRYHSSSPCVRFARLHTSNTAELSGIIEARSFLGPAGPVARDSQACIVYDSKHAPNMCMGMIQSCTNVPLGLTKPN